MKFENYLTSMRARLTKMRVPGKIIFIVTGVLATVWFLVRVIPKPSRAGYPCMRTAAPIMSSFVVWALANLTAVAAFRKTRKLWKNARYIPAATYVLMGLTLGAFATLQISEKVKANTVTVAANAAFTANNPIGEGKGINPGKVIWAYDADATDETCAMTLADPFYDPSNFNQAAIDEMINSSLLLLTGEETNTAAWDAMFKYFNETKGKGAVGYTAGEKIFIKINEGTSSWAASSGLEKLSWAAPITETTPGVTYAILDHLVNVVGVSQGDIWVADPKSHVWQYTYEYLSKDFPDVNYGDRNGNETLGRTKLTKNTAPSVYYSDAGTVMYEAVTETYYKEFTEADYLINLACLKAHARAGITLTAKNHFGSHTLGDSFHLHAGLVSPADNDIWDRLGYGKYRVQVDLMGSSVLGRNTLLFLVDGLFGGPEATDKPVKWQSAPFNNDWPSSIFISQDQVALESVCHDFLINEAETGSVSIWKDRPLKEGVDDYLQQAASSDYWPAGFTYDPDNSGTALPSLGTHEHWNNPVQRQYTRNLGGNMGIELASIPAGLVKSSSFEAREVVSAPVIDGAGDDECWKTVDWNHIDKLWIPWGENTIPFDDFDGKFKVMWSSVTDLMYFVVETNDDVFVDGYTYDDNDYPDFDIVEVFIDEDHSGGGHIFDNATENAENAFSYHIAIDQPADGSTTTTAHVMDIAGTNWGDRTNPDYFSHFPEFTVKRNGNKLTWEFSMQVHNDAYDPADPAASLVDLTEGKVMGLSMAYCDNDTPGTTRDNFFGSVAVTADAYNNHWMNSDDYGALTLVASGTAVNHAPVVTSGIQSYVFANRDEEVTIVADLSAYFNDEDGDNLTYSAVTSDANLVLNLDGVTLKGTAKSGFSGTAMITVSAFDVELYSASTKFMASAANSAPYLISAINDYEVKALGTTEPVYSKLSWKFGDPDSDVLTFSGESDDSELSVIITGEKLEIATTLNFVGPATVTITANDGEFTVQDDFQVTSTVGLEIHSIRESLQLYPNPVTTGYLRVEYESGYRGEIMIRLLGMNGQLYKSIYTEKSGERFSETIQVQHLQKGSYIMEIHQGGASLSSTFVK